MTKEQRDTINKCIQSAFVQLRQISVSGDDVDRMFLARTQLNRGFELLNQLPVEEVKQDA